MTDASTHAPALVADPGRIPPPRHGSVAFFANLSHIFFENAELTDELRQTVEGLRTYGGRLLPLIGLLWDGEQNLLALESRPLSEIIRYFESTLGLRLPEVIHFDPDIPPAEALIELLRSCPERRIDGFVTDEKLASLARCSGVALAGSVAGSQNGNNKRLLHQYLAACGEPVFDTREARSPAGVAQAAAELSALGYHSAVAKSQIGASGIGLVRFDCDRPPSIAPSHFRDGPCLIQGWIDESVDGIDHVSSPSVQMMLREASIHLFDITDQILSPGSIHEGNTAPPVSFNDPHIHDELLRQAGIVARWLHQQGYRGTASADFHLAFHRDGHVSIRVCEVNARVTGATYPSVIARHFKPGGAWKMRNLRLPEPRPAQRLLETLVRAQLLFQKNAHGGVLPINFNYDEDRNVTKGQFLFLGDSPEDVRDWFDRAVALETLTITRD